MHGRPQQQKHTTTSSPRPPTRKNQPENIGRSISIGYPDTDQRHPPPLPPAKGSLTTFL